MIKNAYASLGIQRWCLSLKLQAEKKSPAGAGLS